MDNSYASLDPTVLRAATSSPNYMDRLLRPPPFNGSNSMQLSSGLHEVTSRVKCEDTVSGPSGMLRTATQFCEKALKLGTLDLSFNPSAMPCDLRAIARAHMPSSMPVFDTMDFIAASNSFNFLGPASDYMHSIPLSTMSSSDYMSAVPSVSSSASEYMSAISASEYMSAMSSSDCISAMPSSGNNNPTSTVSSIPNVLDNMHHGAQSRLPQVDCFKQLAGSASCGSTSFTLQGKEPFEACTTSGSSFPVSPSSLSCLASLAQPSSGLLNSVPEDAVSKPTHSQTLPVQPLMEGGAPDGLKSLNESPDSPSKQDSSVLSADDSDADLKSLGQNNKKRTYGFRKAQQKRVVCVPITADSKQKGDTPPSDLWAWRKYGQKPIKGSPYPRGYYKCSSFKGCSGRKQVERSRSDPTMLVVTYTSEHNHPWPPASQRSSTHTSTSASSNCASKPKILQNHEETSSCTDTSGNLFSSIINSANADDEQVVSSLESLHDEESLTFQTDVDLLRLSRTSTESDGVFDDLGELPELSAIFNKGYLEEKINEVGL